MRSEVHGRNLSSIPPFPPITTISPPIDASIHPPPPTTSRLLSPPLLPPALSTTATSKEPQERSTGTCIVPDRPAAPDHRTYRVRCVIRHTARTSIPFQARLAEEKSLLVASLWLPVRINLLLSQYIRQSWSLGNFPSLAETLSEFNLYLRHSSPLYLTRPSHTTTTRSSSISR
jgi:hypothetical protein